MAVFPPHPVHSLRAVDVKDRSVCESIVRPAIGLPGKRKRPGDKAGALPFQRSEPQRHSGPALLPTVVSCTTSVPFDAMEKI